MNSGKDSRTVPPEFSVIGLGRMAQALVLPLLESGRIAPDQLVASVGSQASIQQRTEDCPEGLQIFVAGTDGADRVWDAPIQLLAVKPQRLDAVAASAPMISGNPLLISVLAGVNLTRLQQLFPGHLCVRAVPNTPALVGAGLTALAWGEGVSDQQRQKVVQLFADVGEVLELPEEKLDAFLALTSSGPAFVALITEAMADGAVAAGLPRDLAHRLAHRTLAGTAQLLDQRSLHPGQLKDMVTSPAGTTIAGIRKLEQSGVRSALIEAVLAAAERSRALA